VQPAGCEGVGEQEILDADRSTKPAERRRERLQSPETGIELGGESPGAGAPEGAGGVGVRVVADFVAPPDDFPDERGVAGGAFADEEKRRAGGVSSGSGPSSIVSQTSDCPVVKRVKVRHRPWAEGTNRW
jgi:hypothetical protein